MQTTKLFNAELMKKFSSETPLGEVIRTFEEDFMERGEVICEIRVNDIFLSESDEKRFSGAKLSEIKSLEIRSRRPDELVLSSKLSIIKFIPELKTHCLKASEVARRGELRGNQKVFAEVFDGCHWITEVLSLLKAPLFKEREKDLGKRWDKIEQTYSASVKELFGAFEKQDLVVVADVLEYELTEALDKWLELLGDNKNK